MRDLPALLFPGRQIARSERDLAITAFTVTHRTFNYGRPLGLAPILDRSVGRLVGLQKIIKIEYRNVIHLF